MAHRTEEEVNAASFTRAFAIDDDDEDVLDFAARQRRYRQEYHDESNEADYEANDTRNAGVGVIIVEDDTVPILPEPLLPVPPPVLRNGPIVFPWIEVAFIETKKGRLNSHDAIELLPEERNDGDFLLIKHILKNERTGEVKFRGLRFRRLIYLPVPNRWTNEVCLIVSQFKDDQRELFEQGMEEVTRSQYIRKRTLIITRDPLPYHSFRDSVQVILAGQPGHARQRKFIREEMQLVCRYVYTTVYEKTPTAKSKKVPKATEGEIRRVYHSESDITVVESDNNLEFIQKHHKETTYGTGCCGAGGDLTGAALAGAKLVFAWDHDKSACKTVRRNYPQLMVRKSDQYDIIHGDTAIPPPKVLHILHLSWPCRFFSPAHTVAGKDDTENMALIFATEQHLRYFQPLVHTQEQTSGIITHHPLFFWNLIQNIVTCGYNIRWKMAQFQEYGLPALRKRVIIIAAKDTVPLPKFPKPTHGPGRRPFKDIWTAVGRIPKNATSHLDMITYYKTPREPYNPSIAFAKCITTSGGANAHWDGLYPFTPRQMASLQTFRNSYQFVGKKTEIKKQVGNAIPPAVWRHFVEAIKRTLEDWMAGNIDEEGNRIRGSSLSSSSSSSFTVLNNKAEDGGLMEVERSFSPTSWVNVERLSLEGDNDIEMWDAVNWTGDEY